MLETVTDVINVELQPKLREVVDRLPSYIPEDFRKRALVAARYITELDSGTVKGDKARERFRDQLTSTGFIGSVYMRHQYSNLFPNAPDPQTALPQWLYGGKKSDSEHLDVESIESKYQEWVQTKGFEISHGPSGTYYEVGSEDSSVPKTRTFKCYIEGGNLTKGLRTSSLQAVIDDLKKQQIEPNSMKLFEGERLVLYYHHDVGLSDKIRETFRAHGLDFRGPAQDVWEVQITEDNTLRLKSVSSNDGTLGEGGHTPIKYKPREYRPADFLENYLQLCLWAGKAPDEPYKTSFVWFTDPENKAEGELELLAKAQVMTGYPVLYAKHKFDLIDKKWSSHAI